jgi:RsmE family RNA methyltransferase
VNLILLFKNDMTGPNTYRLCDKRADHIKNILKCQPGDKLEVGLLDGPKGTATIESIDNSGVVVTFDDQGDIEHCQPEIDLICALPRPQTLKRVLENAATMGVRKIHLINSRRVEKCYFSASAMDKETIRKHLIKGLSQGRRTLMPEVSVHRRFKVFFNGTLDQLEKTEKFKARKLLPDLEVSNKLPSHEGTSPKRILLAIGPEGGWIDSEVQEMSENGFEKFRLGQSPLRVENAVVAALTLIEHTYTT